MNYRHALDELQRSALKSFDSALELACKQALRRIKENADRDVAEALPAACSKYVSNSAECNFLKQRTLNHVEEAMTRRCSETLERLSRDAVCREALAAAAEQKVAAAVERLQRWVYAIGGTSLLALGVAVATMRRFKG